MTLPQQTPVADMSCEVLGTDRGGFSSAPADFDQHILWLNSSHLVIGVWSQPSQYHYERRCTEALLGRSPATMNGKYTTHCVPRCWSEFPLSHFLALIPRQLAHHTPGLALSGNTNPTVTRNHAHRIAPYTCISLSSKLDLLPAGSRGWVGSVGPAAVSDGSAQPAPFCLSVALSGREIRVLYGVV